MPFFVCNVDRYTGRLVCCIARQQWQASFTLMLIDFVHGRLIDQVAIGGIPMGSIPRHYDLGIFRVVVLL